MKMAGVAGAKHPTLKRGDAIPLSPEEKVKLLAKEEVCRRSPEGHRFLATSAELVGSVQVINGRDVKPNPDPNQYIGTVLVKYRTLRLNDDRLFPEKVTTVKLHAKDVRDSMGLDDIEAVEFTVVKE